MKRFLIVCLLIVPAGCRQEATFQGKRTSYWIKELKSPWYMARMRAANALSNLGPEAQRAIPDLVQLLEDKESLVRWSAATTLGQFGPNAHEALPVLKKLAAEDADPSVRFAAETAVKQITRPISNSASP